MQTTLATPANVTPEDAAPVGCVGDTSLSPTWEERKLEISDPKKVKNEQSNRVKKIKCRI